VVVDVDPIDRIDPNDNEVNPVNPVKPSEAPGGRLQSTINHPTANFTLQTSTFFL
jgi:hypothetical protein